MITKAAYKPHALRKALARMAEDLPVLQAEDSGSQYLCRIETWGVKLYLSEEEIVFTFENTVSAYRTLSFLGELGDFTLQHDTGEVTVNVHWMTAIQLEEELQSGTKTTADIRTLFG